MKQKQEGVSQMEAGEIVQNADQVKYVFSLGLDHMCGYNKVKNEYSCLLNIISNVFQTHITAKSQKDQPYPKRNVI